MDWRNRSAYVFIKTKKGRSQESWKKFQTWDNVIGTWIVTGDWDVIVWFDAQDWDTVHRCVTEIKKWDEVEQKLNAKQIKDIWNQVEFIKLDFIINIDNIFNEASIIYTFDKIDKDELLKGLREEINELKKEGKYYKVLKRYFSMLNIIKPNDARIGALLKFFNSGYGQLYRNKSNLETIKLLSEYYNDKDTKERIKINIKDIGLGKYIKSKKDLDNIIKKYQGILNEASEKVYSELDL